MNKLLQSALILSIILGLAGPHFALAQTGSVEAQMAEAKRQLDALNEEQKKLQTALDEVSREGQTLQSTVKTLDTTKSKLTNDLKITQTKISSANLTISKLGTDINKNEQSIEHSRSAIEEALRRLAGYDSQGLVYGLLVYDNMSEVWSDTANLIDTQEALGEEINSLQTAQKQLVENKTAKEKQKTTLVSLSSELTGQKKVVEETQATKTKLLAETRSKEAEFQRMLAENEARAEEFEKQLASFESQLKASDHTTLPGIKKGVLSWPLEKVFITQYFGYTPAARLLYKSGSHNGIDFRATVGTAVKSVRGGIVQGMGNTDEQRGCYSYGRWLLIKHDNGLSSIYSHLSAIVVTTGQALSTGQIIGYSGGQPRANGSGASTGPHLHFGLYASAGVRIAQYVSSTYCKNVFIPLANPQDYLDPLAYLPSL